MTWVSMKWPELGEVDDVVEARPDLLARQPQHRAVEVDVVPPGELGLEAGAELEQRRERAADERPGRWSAAGSPADALEQRRLARAVPADDARRSHPGLDGEGDVVERRKVRVIRPPRVDQAVLERAVPLVKSRKFLRRSDLDGRHHSSELLCEVASSSAEQATPRRGRARSPTMRRAVRAARRSRYSHVGSTGSVFGGSACRWSRPEMWDYRTRWNVSHDRGDRVEEVQPSPSRWGASSS